MFIIRAITDLLQDVSDLYYVITSLFQLLILPAPFFACLLALLSSPLTNSTCCLVSYTPPAWLSICCRTSQSTYLYLIAPMRMRPDLLSEPGYIAVLFIVGDWQFFCATITIPFSPSECSRCLAVLDDNVLVHNIQLIRNPTYAWTQRPIDRLRP